MYWLLFSSVTTLSAPPQQSSVFTPPISSGGVLMPTLLSSISLHLQMLPHTWGRNKTQMKHLATRLLEQRSRFRLMPLPKRYEARGCYADRNSSGDTKLTP